MIVCSGCGRECRHVCPDCKSELSAESSIPSTDLLDSMHFRNIITQLKARGMRVSARWLSMRVGGLTIAESDKYVQGCNVVSDGVELKESNYVTMQKGDSA
jgi:hypothetical protein